MQSQVDCSVSERIQLNPASAAEL